MQERDERMVEAIDRKREADELSQRPHFSVEVLPGDPKYWPTYRKKVLTHAIRITGPFVVLTSEGTMSCADGYLAVDARGYPYPIAAAEFELIYEPAEA